MFNINDYSIFTENKNTLKELSKDNSDKFESKYMTDSDIEAINFDMVKRGYVNNLSLSEDVAASVDAFMVLENNCLLVEFKNGDMNNEKTKLKQKILNSLLILCDILKCDISATRRDWFFILVYSEQKNPLSNHIKKSNLEIANHICKKADTSIIRFGLEKFKTLYFKDVYTYTEKEFEDYLLKSNIYEKTLKLLKE